MEESLEEERMLRTIDCNFTLQFDNRLQFYKLALKKSTKKSEVWTTMND